MTLLQIYRCFCDEIRLRIIHLLRKGPLCVCHFQELLAQPQVRVSKHLQYLKTKGMVVVSRHQNWRIYSLPPRPSPELEANLKCLLKCVSGKATFKADLKRLQAMRSALKWLSSLPACSPKASCK